LRIAGGAVEIAGFTATLNDGHPEFATRVALKNLHLEELTEELDIPRMSGGLSAELGNIRYAQGILSTDGTAEVQVFGGAVRVANMRFEKPFSPYSTFHADIDFTGIDLYSLTHTFAFGEMNGIMDGYVHGLRLFGATPSNFVAGFETRPGGRRNISVRALNNLTLVSQGGLSSALSRGIYRFIDFYRYRKIGLVCILENDVFQMRGTALPGSDQYLVDGGLLPPKINIIAPSRPISFKEMVKRLRRIETSGNVSGG
jgi:hypothetical protein